MAGLTAENYNLNGNGNSGTGNSGNNNSRSNRNNTLSTGNNVSCPPALGANDPLPQGYVAFARAAVQRRNAARTAAGLGVAGGTCGGRRHCVCSGMGCDDLWTQWAAAGCPDAASATITHPGVIENENNFGLAGNYGNNNSNVSSIHSYNNENTQDYKMSKMMNLENRFNTKKRKQTRRRRATRSNDRNRSNRSNRRTRSRR